MLRFLRPLLAAAVAAAVCAALQGAVVAKVVPDAGWPAATLVLDLLLLPPILLWGLAVAAAAPSRAGSPAGTLLGLGAGGGAFLMPVLARLLDAPAPGPGLAAAVLLVGACLWGAAARFLARRPPPAPAGPAVRLLGRLLAAAALACAAAGLLLPGPAPAIGALPPPAPGAVDPGLPNLALVVLDTVRADRLGCYGAGPGRTPVLDGLAARGMRYSRAVAPGSHTAPSHASIFTGLPPSEHGVLTVGVGLPPAEPETLAARLAARGYATVGVTANFVLRRARGFARGFHLYDDSLVCLRGISAATEAVLEASATGRWWGSLGIGRLQAGKLLVTLLRPRSAATAAADAVVDRTAAHLADCRGGGRPVFLFLNFMDAHTPYQPPAPFRERFLHHDPGPFDGTLGALAFQRRYAALNEDLQRGGEVSADLLAALGELYDAELAFLDSQLQRLLDILEASSDRPWLLVVTADHGEHFGEHGVLGHGHGLWEETQHVPLLVAGPGVEPGIWEKPVSLLDLAPTLLAAAGARADLGRGRVLPGLPWSSPGGGRPEPVWAEHGSLEDKRLFPPVTRVALYDDAWKLHLAVDEAAGRMRADAAFDLEQDPGETRPRPPARFPGTGGLPAWEASWWQRHRAARARGGGELQAAGPGERARLEELGY